ncbi:MAG: GNAT family N-acetyltransferase [Crocinitomicaceae bacterium]
MDFTIRTVQQSDNSHLAEVIRSCFHDFGAPTKGTVYEDPTTDDLFSLFKTEKSILFVADFKGNAIGCCGLFPTSGLENNTVELVKFYLAKEFRNKGIGKKLFETCLIEAQKLGFHYVYIESLPEFSAAVDLYIAYEFHHLDKPLGNSGHTGCNIWMKKKLHV